MDHRSYTEEELNGIVRIKLFVPESIPLREDMFMVTSKRYEWLEKYKPFLSINRRWVNVEVYYKGEYVAVHRLICRLEYGPPSALWKQTLVDHIDRNPLNNHPSNLRWATHQENSLNRTPYKKAFSTKERPVTIDAV